MIRRKEIFFSFLLSVLTFIYVPFLSFRVATPRALKIVLRLAVAADFSGRGLRACDPETGPFLPFRGLPETQLSYAVHVTKSF